MTSIGYADDMTFVITGQNIDELKFKADNTFRKAAKWLNENKLKLAEEKTECILLTERKIREQIFLRVDAAEIMTRKVVKYLNVLVSGNRMFSEHVNKICQKTSRFAEALMGNPMPNTRGCNFEARRLFYLVVQAIILYVAPIWYHI